jgi:hypothetical protein
MVKYLYYNILRVVINVNNSYVVFRNPVRTRIASLQRDRMIKFETGVPRAASIVLEIP